MKPIRVTSEQVAGLRPAELQSYDEFFQEVGVKPVDLETIPHRKLTHLEAAQLMAAFWDTEQHFSEEYDSVYHRLGQIRERIQKQGVPDEGVREAIDAASDLHWNFARAFGVLAYLAGQREGFRLGAAAVTRAANDPDLAAAVMGALVDDKQADKLIGQLATGKADPEYVR